MTTLREAAQQALEALKTGGWNMTTRAIADLERAFAVAFDDTVHVLTLYASHDDALSALREDTVIINLRDANSSALVREASHERSRHVVMPLRL